MVFGNFVYIDIHHPSTDIVAGFIYSLDVLMHTSFFIIDNIIAASYSNTYCNSVYE